MSDSYFSTVFTSEDYGNFPEYSNVVDSKLSTIFCNKNEVSHLLRNLNPHKSPGPDLLSPRVLKECAIEIASPFCLFLNRSFLAGEVPCAWKIANIVPVHKKGIERITEKIIVRSRSLLLHVKLARRLLNIA